MHPVQNLFVLRDSHSMLKRAIIRHTFNKHCLEMSECKASTYMPPALSMDPNHVSVNQNNDFEYEARSSLYYCNRIKDPTVKDISCRLVLKANTLGDLQLLDLVKDMVYYTQATINHTLADLKKTQAALEETQAALEWSEENKRYLREKIKRLQIQQQRLNTEQGTQQHCPWDQISLSGSGQDFTTTTTPDNPICGECCATSNDE